MTLYYFLYLLWCQQCPVSLYLLFFYFIDNIIILILFKIIKGFLTLQQIIHLITFLYFFISAFLFNLFLVRLTWVLFFDAFIFLFFILIICLLFNFVFIALLCSYNLLNLFIRFSRVILLLLFRLMILFCSRWLFSYLLLMSLSTLSSFILLSWLRLINRRFFFFLFLCWYLYNFSTFTIFF